MSTRKTKLHSITASLVCVACLTSSCTPTTTWRQIRANPGKYMQQEVCIKGQVERVKWNSPEKHGDMILRDRNRDTGPVRFFTDRDWRGPGMKVVVLGKVQQEQRDTGSRTYILLREYKKPSGWWQTARQIPRAVAVTAGVVLAAGVLVGAAACCGACACPCY